MSGPEIETREIEQRMQMARPWDSAEEGSIWAITGAYPGKRHSFTECLATVLPGYTHGTDDVVFVFVGALAAVNEPVIAGWITYAKPLVLVHRDEPGTAYWSDEQCWLPSGGTS